MSAGMAAPGSHPTTLRIALWCPQGHAKLPLLVAGCLSAVPAEWIVWSSDDNAPTPPEDMTADLWLVFCTGAPPPPPHWRKAVSGLWAVLPGETAGWTGATKLAVDAWQPDIVLSDMLPDETDNVVFNEWNTEGRLRWIHGLMGASSSPHEGPTIAVVTDRSSDDWYSEYMLPTVASALGGRMLRLDRSALDGEAALGGRLGERLLLYGENPAAWAGVLRAAIAAQARVAIVGRAPVGTLRAFMLADVVAWIGQMDSDQDVAGGPLRRAIRALVPRSKQEKSEALANWDWTGWTTGLVEARGGLSGPLRAAARLARGWSVWNQGARGASVATVLRIWFQAAVPEMWRVEQSPEVRDEVADLAWCLERLVRLGWNELLDHHRLARARAYLGDTAAAEASLDYLRQGGSVVGAELPGTVALLLWRQGDSSGARRVLRRFVATPAATPFACFVCAVAAEVVGETGVTVVQLGGVLQNAPRLLAEEPSGACLALAALVARTAGDEVLAERLRAAARTRSSSIQYLFGLSDSVSPGAAGLDARWRALFGAALDDRVTNSSC